MCCADARQTASRLPLLQASSNSRVVWPSEMSFTLEQTMRACCVSARTPSSNLSRVSTTLRGGTLGTPVGAIINGQRVGPPLGIRSVAADSAGTVLFANVHVGGIPRSRDGGKTWQPTIDINSDVQEVRVQQADPRIIVAATAIGLCISRDFGETWAVEQDGLHAPYCSAVAFSGDDILASASTDHFASEGRIYRRPIKTGGVLEAVENGPP